VATKPALSTTPDTYLELLSQFRLVPIKDDNHLKTAHEMIDRLLQEELDDPRQQYLDVLANLVEAYEDVHFPIPNASEIDVLRELMRVNNLSQTDLAKKVGIVQSTISAVLKGTRKLTKNQVIKLADFFSVSPAAFLPSRPEVQQSKWSTGTPTGGSRRRIAGSHHA
jgi:HTH-type transcriptional regulator/antitoxin HigA